MNELEVVHNKVGRPLKYQTVEELQNGIQSYFDECIKEVPIKDKDGEYERDKDGHIILEPKIIRPYTITGLALSLGTTRETLCEYERNPMFVDTIKRAKELVANYVEEQCLIAKNPAGAIFLLKNHGFTDKQEIDHTVTQKIITVDMIGSIDD